LQAVSDDFGLAVFAVLARRKVALLNRTLIAETFRAFEEKLNPLATAQTAYCIFITCQVFFSFNETGLQDWRPFFPVKSSRVARLASHGLLSIARRSTRDVRQTLNYTRLRFGGLQPLCGIGVTSLIARTSIPAADNARIADSRPEPGPLTRTSTVRTP
jgi:hypothetical protein